MDTYTTSSVAKLFGVVDQTVKNWSSKFEEFLSATGQQSRQGQKRVFTLDDVRVFALAHEMTNQGFNYADVRASLQNGSRGEIPETPGKNSLTVTPQAFARLREINDQIQSDLDERTSERDEALGQVKLLKEQLDQKEDRIERLYRENAELKVGKNE